MKKLTKLMTLVLVFLLAVAPLAYALDMQNVNDPAQSVADQTAASHTDESAVSDSDSESDDLSTSDDALSAETGTEAETDAAAEVAPVDDTEATNPEAEETPAAEATDSTPFTDDTAAIENPLSAETETAVTEETPTLEAMASKIGEIKPMATIQVTTADELQDAIDASSPGDTIQLMNDIDLAGFTDPINIHKQLVIPQDKSVTITGGYTIWGGNNLDESTYDTNMIIVDGSLVIDDINISRDSNHKGDGIFVNGSLTLEEGTISEQNHPSITCTAVTNFGSFIMNGGRISNNNRAVANGGIIGGSSSPYDSTFIMNDGLIEFNGSNMGNTDTGGVSNTGTFRMYDGEIRNNISGDFGGGAINNWYNGAFIMYGGSIHHNTSKSVGGGIYQLYNGTANLIGGEISNNSALGDTFVQITGVAGVFRGQGGGIFAEDLRKLSVSEDCIFRDNFAARVNAILNPETDPVMAAVYASNIKCTEWTNGAEYGYNDTDIGYFRDPRITMNTVAVSDSYSNASGAGDYVEGMPVLINAGTRPGYAFARWIVNSGDVVLANPNDPITSFTMPATAVSITATWAEVVPIQQYTVTHNFNYTGAPAPVVITVDEGSLLGDATSQVTKPVRSGYTFRYWRFNADGTGVPDAATPVNANITLYAVWEPVATDENPPIATDDPPATSSSPKPETATAMPKTGDNTPYILGGAALALLAGAVLLRQRQRLLH